MSYIIAIWWLYQASSYFSYQRLSDTLSTLNMTFKSHLFNTGLVLTQFSFLYFTAIYPEVWLWFLFWFTCLSLSKYPCTPSGATDWFTPSVDPSILEIFKNGNWSMQNPSPDCQCSTPQRNIMLPDCPPGAGGLPPPQVRSNMATKEGNSTHYWKKKCKLIFQMLF